MQAAATSAPPRIIGQPPQRIVSPGEATSFSVVVSDPRAPAYQWQFNGANISGATNDALLLRNVSTNSEGEYRVLLTNPSGSVTSAPAMLWIDNDADGLPDSWELASFGNLNQLPNSDFDGDGSSNLQEFLDGTSPTKSDSGLFRLTVVRDGGSVAILPEQAAYTNGQIVTLTATATSNEAFRAWIGDVSTRNNPVTLVMTNNKSMFARFTPIVFTWTNFAGGDWNIATNWTPNLVPGSNDNVVISGLLGQLPGDFTVTLDTPAACSVVTLDAGLLRIPTLTGNGTLTVRERMLWRGGIMSGAGRTLLESGATLMLDTANGLTLNTRTLELGGQTLWSSGGILTLNNAVITNREGAVFHVLAAGAINRSGGTPRFDNAGTLHKTANGGITTIGALMGFNNFGLAEIDTGTLQLAGGGSANGAFNVAAGAMVEWTSGTYTLIPGAQLNGSGQYRLNIGNVNADADVTVDNLDLTHPNSTLGGTGVVTIARAMNWSVGAMSGTGRTLIAPNATLNVANAITPSQVNLHTRTLENAGTVLWTKSDGSIGLNGSVITNRPGALFHAMDAAGIGSLGGGPRFDNAGVFRRSGGTGTTVFSVGMTFNNSGTVDIRRGILRANGGYSSAPIAVLSCALGGTAPGSGYGQLQVAGSVTLNGALRVELLPAFTPATNDAFTVVTAASLNGVFNTFHYPSDAVTMSLGNNPTSVVLRVTDLVSPPVLTPTLAVQFLNGELRICWSAKSNTTYQVEFTTDLSSSNWLPVPGLPSSTGDTICFTDSPSSTHRFYRVRLMP